MSTIEVWFIGGALVACIIGFGISIPFAFAEMSDRRRERRARLSSIVWTNENDPSADGIGTSLETIEVPWVDSLEDKVDTNTISVVVSNYGAEVPGQTERRIEEMSNVYLMNTKTTIKASAAEKNEYYNGEECTLIFFRKTTAGTVIAAQTYGDADNIEIGNRYNMVQDTGYGHREAGTIEVIGFKQGDFEVGTIPAKTIPFYVYK